MARQRDLDAPDMFVVVARALVTSCCPVSLDQRMHGKQGRGEAAYHCGYCAASLPDDLGCPACSDRYWHVLTTWPDMVLLPDLEFSKRNGGALLGLLEEAKVEYMVGYKRPHKSHDRGGHYVTVLDLDIPTQRASTLALAVAKAWLLLNNRRTPG